MANKIDERTLDEVLEEAEYTALDLEDMAKEPKNDQPTKEFFEGAAENIRYLMKVIGKPYRSLIKVPDWPQVNCNYASEMIELLGQEKVCVFERGRYSQDSLRNAGHRLVRGIFKFHLTRIDNQFFAWFTTK